jgi:glycosyl transferase family 25
MQVYVINLKKDADRLQHMSRQLASYNIEFERVDAVDGRVMPEGEFQAFVKARSGKPTPWGRGQMGCWLSHSHTWEKIAAGDDAYGLILEDDMHISPDIVPFVQAEGWIPEDADIVKLEAPNNRVRLGKTLSVLNQHHVRQLRSTAWCAGGYILSRQAARFLVKQPSSTHMAVDAFLFSLELSAVARQLKLYQVAPAVVVQDKFREEGAWGMVSNIESPLASARAELTLPGRIVGGLKWLLNYRYVNFQ